MELPLLWVSWSKGDQGPSILSLLYLVYNLCSVSAGFGIKGPVVLKGLASATFCTPGLGIEGSPIFLVIPTKSGDLIVLSLE